MKGEPKYKTDIYRFDGKKLSWTRRADYDLVFSFKFLGNEFYLTYKDGNYFVCTYFDEKDSRLYSLYLQKEIEDGLKAAPGEVVSEFRKRYIKNNVTPDIISEFILDPVSYVKNKKKK